MTASSDVMITPPEPDGLGTVTAEEVLRVRHLLDEVGLGVEVPNLMAESKAIADELVELATYVMQHPNWRGMPLEFTSRIVDSGANVFLVIRVLRSQQPPETPSEETPSPTVPPGLIPTKRMAERAFQHALTFWWPKPSPGVMYILWDSESGHKWERVNDQEHPGQTGFEWLSSQRPGMGGPTTDEGHGMGLVKEEDGVTWIVAPTDLDVFALLPDGTWQIVIA